MIDAADMLRRLSPAIGLASTVDPVNDTPSNPAAAARPMEAPMRSRDVRRSTVRHRYTVTADSTASVDPVGTLVQAGVSVDRWYHVRRVTLRGRAWTGQEVESVLTRAGFARFYNAVVRASS